MLGSNHALQGQLSNSLDQVLEALRALQPAPVASTPGNTIPAQPELVLVANPQL